LEWITPAVVILQESCISILRGVEVVLRRNLTIIRGSLFLCALTLLLTSTGQLAHAEEHPVSYFFKRPDISQLTISPDGNHAAAIIPTEDQKVVAILDITDITAAKLIQSLTPPKGQDAANPYWVNDERIAFATIKEQRKLTIPRLTGNYFAGDIDGENKRQLAGFGSGKTWHFMLRVASRFSEKKKEIVVVSAAPNERQFKLVRLNVNTGKTRTIGHSPFRQTSQFVADRDNEPRFATGTEPDDYLEQKIKYRDPDGKWDYFKHPFDGDIRVLGFDENSRDAWIASDDINNFGLYKLNTETMEYTHVLRNEHAEVSRLLWDRYGENVIGAVFQDGYPVNQYIDPEHEDVLLLQQLSSQFPGQYVRMNSFSEDGSRATVFVQSDVNPGFTYLYEVNKNRLIPISPALGWVDPEELSEMRPVNITARDNVVLHGYTTLPKSKKHENLPMIVMVHGGPHGPRDSWGWNPEAQYFANHGYLVLQINFRGSGGYSKQFEESGYKLWGTTMQDDVTDATLWAVKQGLADPERMCIYGASYGGYSTLVGITREPELYKCGFAYVGIYDLPLMFKSGDISARKSGIEYLEKALGTDDADLSRRSPINYVDKIKAALFLAHGKEDHRADVKHYYALREKLDEAGIPYDYLLTEKEAHGFYDLSNREELYGKMITFFEENIGK